MKALILKSTLTLFVALMVTTGVNLFAQQGRGFNQERRYRSFFDQDRPGILNLTDEQKEKIKELTITHQEEIQSLRNQMSENSSKYRELMSEEKFDIKAINENIDEKTGILNKIMKSNAEFRQKFNELLTDEQKSMLDTEGRGFGRKYDSFGRGSRRGYDSFRRGFRRGYDSFRRGFRRGYESFRRGFRQGPGWGFRR
jgi:Spy/CpxP family protein refolding chaperone